MAESTRDIFPEQSIAAAFADERGVIVEESTNFRRMMGLDALDPDFVRSVMRSGATRLYPVVRENGPIALLACGPASAASQWALPPDLASPPTHGVVALGICPPPLWVGLDETFTAFGLTQLQQRVTRALIETGSLPDAAKRCGISYNTAREAKSEVMARLGYRKSAELVQALTLASFGIGPGNDEGSTMVAEVFGLTPRQLALSIHLAEGETRQDAARALGISTETAKKELDAAFVALGVGSVSALSRVIGEARMLGMLTNATGGSLVVSDHVTEPFATIPSPDGRLIAYSDYGPAGGAPVMVLHSSMTNRPVARPLVAALQAAGFRPLAIDRPGFGATDPVSGVEPAQHDPWDIAAQDFVHFCQMMGFDNVALVARGAAQAVLAIQRRSPRLLTRVALVNPDPPTRADSVGKGPLAAIKQSLFKRPSTIAAVARIATRFTTPARQRFIMMRSIKGIAPDEAVMADPRNLADYQRAVRSFGSGKIEGFINEQSMFASGAIDAPINGTPGWTVFVGAEDFIHQPADTVAYWRQILPDAQFEIVHGAGRFLAISHAAMVVAALEP